MAASHDDALFFAKLACMVKAHTEKQADWKDDLAAFGSKAIDKSRGIADAVSAKAVDLGNAAIDKTTNLTDTISGHAKRYHSDPSAIRSDLFAGTPGQSAIRGGIGGAALGSVGNVLLHKLLAAGKKTKTDTLTDAIVGGLAGGALGAGGGYLANRHSVDPEIPFNSLVVDTGAGTDVLPPEMLEDLMKADASTHGPATRRAVAGLTESDTVMGNAVRAGTGAAAGTLLAPKLFGGRRGDFDVATDFSDSFFNQRKVDDKGNPVKLKSNLVSRMDDAWGRTDDSTPGIAASKNPKLSGRIASLKANLATDLDPKMRNTVYGITDATDELDVMTAPMKGAAPPKKPGANPPANMGPSANDIQELKNQVRKLKQNVGGLDSNPKPDIQIKNLTGAEQKGLIKLLRRDAAGNMAKTIRNAAAVAEPLRAGANAWETLKLRRLLNEIREGQ